MELPYKAEYAKSNKAKCRGCKDKISKGSLRIAIMVQGRKCDLKIPYWFHYQCFTKRRPKKIDDIADIELLRWEDQELIKQTVVAKKRKRGNATTIAAKKLKLEDEPDGDGANDQLEQQMRAQNEMLYSYRDKLEALSIAELEALLKYNNQWKCIGREKMLDELADLMTFGTLERCTECNYGQFVLDKLGYVCKGNRTKWAKCTVITKQPKRRVFLVPSELETKYTFLGAYKYVPGTRLIKDANPSIPASVLKKEKENNKLLLRNMNFVIVGPLKGKTHCTKIKKQIADFGGRVVDQITDNVMAVISTAVAVDEMLLPGIVDASTVDIQVVPVEFFDEVKEYSGRIPELIMKKSICTWGADPHCRLPADTSASSFQFKSPGKIKLGRGGVHPESGLESVAHVYQIGDEKYSSVLGVTDIQKDKNSYYILQVLESNLGDKYWLFRAWGRMGTTRGDNKLEEMTLDEALREFASLFTDKTGGNCWSNKASFVKIPGRLYPIDVDYEGEVELNKNHESKLLKPLQALMELIFDINSMKKLMADFKLDLEKMPLGKLSKIQLIKAYEVLSELQELIESNGSSVSLIDASNRFYTFVPHSFGDSKPPILDNINLIKEKISMVENLLEIETTYSLMKSTGTNNTIDAIYKKLKTDIDILDRESEEFAIIQEYVTNTHAATHSRYKLEIEDVFVVKRHGERERYQPFCTLDNRTLLWHGSRTANYGGILSQGLRIAPPEVPVTGYMFGKGIYFADMVSKSANYCKTKRNKNTGLLMLCEVALGEMWELQDALYVTELPQGKDSVKGVGKTQPNPEEDKKIFDGVIVPLGKAVDLQIKCNESSLDYNEYIVYKEAQVNIKYLIRMKFNYN